MAKKKPTKKRVSLTKPSRRDLQEASRRLRYMDPAAVAKDFPGEGERAAIAAVFEWLSLNSTVAWRLKNGTYTNVAVSKSVRRPIGTSDAIIMDEATYDRARRLLVPEDR